MPHIHNHNLQYEHRTASPELTNCYRHADAPLPSTDANVPLMLDAAAGYIVKRIRARQVNAVSKPGDVAAVLRAFVRLKHK